MTAPPTPAPDNQPTPKRRTGAAAVIVAGGILVSRLLGLVRESLKARYLGASAGLAADAFNAAFRIPNILQTLLGEGVLSASFIPVYANLVARGEREEADRVAGAVAAIMGLLVAVFVSVGVLAAPLLVPLIAPGFTGEKRALVIHLTRIFFPGAGLFVLAAWCLGVLNSHRRFLLSYAAPALWNVAMIAALLWFGPRQGMEQLAVTLAWASVIGAGLHFLVQLPMVLRLAPHLRIALDTHREGVRTIIRNFIPVFVSRGVVQVSSYVDQMIASLLPNGMFSLLFYSQTISVLPVSLFGMAVSAAELPEMSSAVGTADERAVHLRERLQSGLRRIAYFVVPSAAAFLAIGDLLASTLFQHGAFTATDTRYTWGILAGSAVGLLASTLGRLYSSAYYALHDTRTPLRFALVRVALTTILGLLFALVLPRMLGIDRRWGAAGLTASAGIAAWVEFALLRSRLNRRIGVTGVSVGYQAQLWSAAAVAVAAATALRFTLPATHRVVFGIAIIAAYGLAYLGATMALRVPEARGVLRRLRR